MSTQTANPKYKDISRNVYRQGDFILGSMTMEDVEGLVVKLKDVVDLSRQLTFLRSHGVGSLNYGGPLSGFPLEVHMYEDRGKYSARFTHVNDNEGLRLLRQIAETLGIDLTPQN